MTIRPMSTPLNENYSPARPWACIALTPHTCEGDVVGQVGVPVCANGAVVEIAAQAAERARWAGWADSPAGRREIAAEHAWESRVS